ncbi:deoxyhypusine hydroxylase-like [Anneissia japonica]|uniref:deoxyhypusine hydroxylase-like n=1 Tax=Anneissia japonica TaxID=1529436 RepID=UPI00142584FA|nr:deoxyhypusine hydroxylase-like [Anneissia japonica]
MPSTVEIKRIGAVLCDEARPLPERFRALFTLRNLGGETAIDYIVECFSDQSALLKHECAYCLGQMQDKYAIPKLVTVLKDTKQDTMVRHEAGEALGAIGCNSVMGILKEYCNDPIIEVAETCQLAVERIEWLHSKEKQKESSKNPFSSVDPAPPLTEEDLVVLQRKLLDEKLPLFDRYRAMFSLRNINSDASALALAEGLKCSSALFRHEIAYVLGQMQNAAGIKQLKCNLQQEDENPMVRHECAEALGSIAAQECLHTLQDFTQDKEVVVRESCEVALDMLQYEQSEDFQYADTLVKLS